jgi:hypothetical protein
MNKSVIINFSVPFIDYHLVKSISKEYRITSKTIDMKRYIVMKLKL